MTTHESSTTPTKVDIDPYGDVVLDVGKDKDRILIRASSRVLSLTSEHFASLLLDPNIKENQSACCKESPKVVPMQEDSPQLMLTLCKITHYKHSTVQPPTGVELIALTMLCDKYECTGAVPMWVTAHLNQYFPFENLYIEHTDLSRLGLTFADVVALAYIYHGHRLFRDASRCLALQTASPCNELGSFTMDQKLAIQPPRRFFGELHNSSICGALSFWTEALEFKRRECISAVCQELCNTICSLGANRGCDCGFPDSDWNDPTAMRGCQTSMGHAGLFLVSLSNSGVPLHVHWFNKASPKTSAYLMLKKTATIAGRGLKLPRGHWCNGLPKAPNTTEGCLLNDKLSALVKELPKKLEGLCVNAVKDIRRSWITGYQCKC